MCKEALDAGHDDNEDTDLDTDDYELDIGEDIDVDEDEKNDDILTSCCGMGFL